MPLSTDVAVLLVAHGTVENLDQIPAFLLKIRRGRPPSDSLVAEMTRRYEAIGGSPMLSVTRAQAAMLAEKLKRPVYVGMRFCRPSIEDALEAAVSDGARRLVVLPVAPYSVALYHAEVAQQLDRMPAEVRDRLELLAIPPYGVHPTLVRAHRDNVLLHAEEGLRRGAPLLFSAHSLPLRVIAAGDAYADEVQASARAIGDALGYPWQLGFQSEGADGGEWLGPPLVKHVDVVAGNPSGEVVVAPIGFLCDHVETLFDLDIELASRTSMLGLRLIRIPALGTHPGLIATLADLVTTVLSRCSDPTRIEEVVP
ncbi:MAG: ferrochelatase [Polyangiaceae bacterium]